MAMLFRLPHSTLPSPVQPRTDPLLLRKEVGPQAAALISNRPAAPVELQATALVNEPAQPPTILMPMDPGQPPPELAKSYPRSGSPDAGSWQGASPTGQGASGAATTVKTHKIVDGDTLPALAEHYLGRADRYAEILEANKDVLFSPGLLPIGAVLRIPSSTWKPSQDPVRAPQRVLVPVPARALQADGAKSS
jgi:nucleoid-associated protein YgaU